MAEPTTALVLAGGGVTGIAWEIGVIDALTAGAVDLLACDLLVGTSAGAAVAAQITSGAPMADLVARQLTPASESKERLVDLDLEVLGPVFALMMDHELAPEVRRARIGAMALGAATITEGERLEIIAARLPSTQWPGSAMQLTAIDAESGAFVTFDRGSGVDLVRAVAASCAVPGIWPAVTIAGHRYIDGGMRSPANADLAAGHDAVLVLAPMPPALTLGLDDEVAALEAGGARVVVVHADEAAVESMGPNPLDPAFRRAALDAGRRQGAAAADEVRELLDPGSVG